MTKEKEVAKKEYALKNAKRFLDHDQDQIKRRLAAEKEALDSVFAGLPVKKDDQYIDVRLRIQNPSNGFHISWALLFGDPSYDQDHRGFWAAGSIDRYTDIDDLFHDLKKEIFDQIAMASNDNYDL